MSDVSLREHLEAKIEALCKKQDLRFKGLEEKIAARDKALELQAEANKVHFVALNNEAARILKAVEVTVSRDTWNAFKQNFDEWVRKVELALGGLLPAKDFNEFKDATNKALQIKDGQSQGVGISADVVGKVISSLALIIAIITGVLVLTRMS